MSPEALAKLRRCMGGLLALALVGMALAAALARLHLNAHRGLVSFCAINDVVNCDRVALSRASVFLGVPVAVWGIFGYALLGALAAWGLRARKPRRAWPIGLLFVTAAAAVVVSISLALVSELVIHAWCLMCMASWLVALATLIVAWGGARTVGVGAAIRTDLTVVSEQPFWCGVAVIAAVGLVMVTAAGYSHFRYWGHRPAPAKPLGEASVSLRGEPLIVVEYSDYECPFCARAHEQLRSTLAGRDDLRIVRKQFPLDSACNPAVKHPMHLEACMLARAALCADAQGRFREMDDALFANQRERLSVQELARRVGLDLDRFGVCLDAPETSQRLAAEIDDGIRAGLQATPSYVVNGVTYSGELPAELIAPRDAGR